LSLAADHLTRLYTEKQHKADKPKEQDFC